MRNLKLKHAALLFGGVFVLLAIGCEKGYFPEPPTPPAPKTPLETTTLEASYVSTAPITLTDAYWKSADFLRVAVSDVNKGMLYPDGFMNMTGTYNGLTAFNNGADPKLVMKAAYDNNKLYIYAEWLDTDISPALELGTLKGPGDPLKPSETTTVSWTSQGNCDRMALAFNISNASSAAGTFVDKGCAASCHLNKMQPSSGSVDIWRWDAATSDALGFAADMVADGTNGLLYDAGQSMAVSNKKTPGDPRSEPAYEWDGVEQTFVRAIDGKTVTLDAGYFLLNKIPFTGDHNIGEAEYHNKTYGCNHCHGENGANGEATPFASSAFARKYSRASIISTSLADGHDGKSYFVQVPAAKVNDLMAFIRGLGGIPGTYLTVPTGSSADVWTVSNIARTKIDVSKPHTLYQVLMVRALTNTNSDDVQFTAPEGKSFPFGVALMNADGKNHIGSLKQTLTFKTKTP